MSPVRPACWLVATWLLSLAIGATGLADNTPQDAVSDEPAASTGLAADRIDELVRQLDDVSFAKRQAASAALAKAGKQVIPALEKAATGDSRETTTRSVDLLKRFHETGDEATKAAAKEALTRLSTCGKPSAASRAQAALAPKPKQGAQAVPWGRPGGGIQIGGGGQIQIQVQAVGGNKAKRISTKIINGVKEIEVQEKDRKIKINEDAAGKIKMEVTEKGENGKEKTSKYEAKDADELKKKHPEAHKIYEEYGKGGGGGIRIQGIQIQPGQMPIPIQPRIQPFRPLQPAGAKDATKQVEESVKRIEEIRKKLDAMEKSEAVKKQLEELKEVQRLLEEARKKLEG